MAKIGGIDIVALAKATVGELALFGNPPQFAEALHVGRPSAGDFEKFAAMSRSAWDRRWFTNNGPLSREFEAKLADYLDVDHCVSMSSGTSAMAIAVAALGLSGEVIMPSFTFVSTAHVLRFAGIEPVFCEIDPDTWNLDAEKCAQAITPKTSAVVATHLWGRACDVEGLESLCERHGIPLIFDAAHAFGCTHNGKRIGSFGTAEVFSFHATKAFHTFEGGAVATNDAALAERLRKLRNFGFNDRGEVEMVGTNAKMSEVHAAMGLTNLGEFDQMIAQGGTCRAAYAEHLDGIPGITLRPEPAGEGHNHHYAAAQLDVENMPLSRDEVIQILQAENVLARSYFHPGIHRMAPYARPTLERGERLPNTIAASESAIHLPAGAMVSADEAQKVCRLLELILTNADELTGTMRTRGKMAP